MQHADCVVSNLAFAASGTIVASEAAEARRCWYVPARGVTVVADKPRVASEAAGARGCQGVAKRGIALTARTIRVPSVTYRAALWCQLGECRGAVCRANVTIPGSATIAEHICAAVNSPACKYTSGTMKAQGHTAPHTAHSTYR